LNTIPISVPALRERKGDIYLLFRKFASDVATQYRMPAISLDEGARQLLENYHWRGNIRQLKNVAEQISAIEQSRNISAEILRRYLPDESNATPIASGHSQAYSDMTTERELLYKILFDMRNDINDLKRMMTEAMSGSVTRNTASDMHRDVVGLLPSSLPAHSDTISYEDDATVEVVEDEESATQTKEDVQREQIMAALRNNGYNRKAAADELFISVRTLYRRMKALGIE
jgi:DNA-binding NtrC family response regulator